MTQSEFLEEVKKVDPEVAREIKGMFKKRKRGHRKYEIEPWKFVKEKSPFGIFISLFSWSSGKFGAERYVEAYKKLMENEEGGK